MGHLWLVEIQFPELNSFFQASYLQILNDDMIFLISWISKHLSLTLCHTDLSWCSLLWERSQILHLSGLSILWVWCVLLEAFCLPIIQVEQRFFIFYIKSNPHIIAGLTVFIYEIFQVVPELPEVICQRQRKRARSNNFFSFFSYVASKLLIFV